MTLFNLPLEANIIDIGGGDSHFVDVLLEKGYKNIYVLGISGNALDRAKQRLGDKVGFGERIDSWNWVTRRTVT